MGSGPSEQSSEAREAVSPPGQARDRAVRRVLWVVLGLNLAVAAAKLGLGQWIGSLALTADGFHALLDSSSNVVGLVGLAVAARPPDPGHPYGHRRFEAMAGFLIGLLIAAGMLEIGRSLLQGLIGSRSAPEPSWPVAIAVAVTIGGNLLISRYEARKGAELRSSLLQADAHHTMSDALGASAVLASLGAAALDIRWADEIATAVVLVLIARTAYYVLRSNFGVLVDEACLDPHEVRQTVLGVSGVHGAHKVRSRGHSDHVFVDLHIHLDPSMSLRRAHSVTHAVMDSIHEQFPEVVDVVIHTEPADGREQDLSSVTPGQPQA
jgi:cation diffusion facilitator family transporter